MAAANLTARAQFPELAAADLEVEVVRMAFPPPCAPLSAFREWNAACARVAADRDAVQAKFTPWLCHFCWGFATIAGQRCPMCQASGLSPAGQQKIRFHHNGE